MPASALMNVMLAAARKAGRSLSRDFGEVEQLQVSLKGPANFVSAADHRAEEILHTELARARPGYGCLMEERGDVEGADRTHRFIVDPLDGTTNFLHGIPQFAISIALERDGKLVAGLIYNPVNHETFTAERGKGAFLNDRRIRVAARTELSDAVIGTGIPHSGRPSHDLFLDELRAVMAASAGVRRIGAAALDLAWTATGRLDGFWERNLRAWDLAAGIVILREAGGYVTDADGKDAMLETGSVVAGNEAIQKRLLKLIKTTSAAARSPA
jgi:myo-inositol-1(or 4)-monophosphatase